VGDKEMALQRPVKTALFRGIVYAAACWAFCAPASGQASPEIQTLSSHTAARVRKTQQTRIFIAGLQECHLEIEICAAFESSLRDDLAKSIPGARFINRQSVINIIEGRGFLAMDAFVPEVLKDVAAQAGADILVTDALQWQHDGYDLTSQVFDAAQHKKLEEFRAKILRSQPDTGEEFLVFKDPETGLSVLIPRGKPSRAPVVQYLVCEKCPDPIYTPEARAQRIQGRVLLLVTVGENGIADHIGVVDGLDGGLTEQAVEAVQRWRFKPALGADGKPVATRVPIDVTFRMPQ
jgi:TonB family protein